MPLNYFTAGIGGGFFLAQGEAVYNPIFSAFEINYDKIYHWRKEQMTDEKIPKMEQKWNKFP